MSALAGIHGLTDRIVRPPLVFSRFSAIALASSAGTSRPRGPLAPSLSVGSDLHFGTNKPLQWQGGDPTPQGTRFACTSARVGWRSDSQELGSTSISGRTTSISDGTTSI